MLHRATRDPFGPGAQGPPTLPSARDLESGPRPLGTLPPALPPLLPPLPSPPRWTDLEENGPVVILMGPRVEEESESDESVVDDPGDEMEEDEEAAAMANDTDLNEEEGAGDEPGSSGSDSDCMPSPREGAPEPADTDGHEESPMHEDEDEELEELWALSALAWRDVDFLPDPTEEEWPSLREENGRDSDSDSDSDSESGQDEDGLESEGWADLGLRRLHLAEGGGGGTPGPRERRAFGGPRGGREGPRAPEGGARGDEDGRVLAAVAALEASASIDRQCINDLSSSSFRMPLPIRSFGISFTSMVSFRAVRSLLLSWPPPPRPRRRFASPPPPSPRSPSPSPGPPWRGPVQDTVGIRALHRYQAPRPRILRAGGASGGRPRGWPSPSLRAISGTWARRGRAGGWRGGAFGGTP